MSGSDNPPAHEAGLFFQELAARFRTNMAKLPAGAEREFAEETARGLHTLGGVARGGTDKSVVDFLTDTTRSQNAGLPPAMTKAILEQYESFRLGLASPAEYAEHIRVGMQPDLEAKRALHGGRSAAREAGEHAADEQGRRNHAAVKQELAGHKPVAPAGKPVAATPDQIMAQHARTARQKLAADLGHTLATPGDGPSVTVILKGAQANARSALAEIKPPTTPPTGLFGILSKIRKPGNTAAVVLTTGLLSAASLLHSQPAEAAEPGKDKPGTQKPKSPGL